MGLVRLLSEREHQTGPAEGLWWEVREAGARARTGEESYLVTSAHAASSRRVDSADGRERSVSGSSNTGISVPVAAPVELGGTILPSFGWTRNVL